ncbi:hypothetical protein C8250_009000 [Streptomyces sp. So13.3]|uniref:hypothetical protein n=1 Tax=Streptomyces sp. So13.3 TaxID=2136173 RepID=UPI001105EF1D|nr:hypothetical protein [Streptomyces sp. So13.3]QNA72021.1 hypothetical protein C8250_009000 [Streptomyces sp. So13.3]
MASIPARAVNLGRQMAAIKAVIPGVQAAVRGGELVCTFTLQPTTASRNYTVRIVYRHRRRPRVTITDPPLALHPNATALPHVYPDGDLCLYLPGEWNEHMFLSNTILPWTSAWLLHYELWLVLGRWTGSGDDHVVPPPASRIR